MDTGDSTLSRSTPVVGQDELGNTMVGLTSGKASSSGIVFGHLHLWTTNTRFQPKDAKWPMFKNNPAHTGSVK